MVCKQCKSNAANQLLNDATNINFINPSTRKIDIKMFTKHLCKKDEDASIDLEFNVLQDSDSSDNMLVSNLNYSSQENRSSDSDTESALEPKRPKKRQIRAGAFDIVEYQGRKIKTSVVNRSSMHQLRASSPMRNGLIRSLHVTWLAVLFIPWTSLGTLSNK